MAFTLSFSAILDILDIYMHMCFLPRVILTIFQHTSKLIITEHLVSISSTKQLQNFLKFAVVAIQRLLVFDNNIKKFLIL